MSRIELLDHGYVELVETWGSDQSIVEAARMSTGKGFLGWGSAKCTDCGRSWETVIGARAPRCENGRGGGHTIDDESKRGDEKLLRFLYENKHATPFEMGGFIVEVKAPIMVYREWHRHRTQWYNEMSARYVPLPDENYVPSLERLMLGSDGKNKQAGTVAGAGALTSDVAQELITEELEFNKAAERFYQKKLQAGVPKELARTHIGVSRYSRMRAGANLRNWLGFLTLRMAPNAQWEIRQYANAVGTLVAERFPRTWELFAEGRS